MWTLCWKLNAGQCLHYKMRIVQIYMKSYCLAVSSAEILIANKNFNTPEDAKFCI